MVSSRVGGRTSPVIARSASRQVKEWLGELQSAAKVLAVHARVCTLVTDQGEVIALVAPEIGDGPLNIVLADWPGFLSGVRTGASVAYGPGRLVLDASEIVLEQADTWEPRPDWEELRARRTAVEASQKSLLKICVAQDAGNALLPLLGAPAPERGRVAALADRFREMSGQLDAGWEGDEVALAQGAAALAGLGDGLTPAGDDFMVGVMLRAWLAHPAPEHFCRVLSDVAAPRTTTLSAAFLRAAARGQCSVAWHSLLAALAEGRLAEIRDSAERVLAHGASSGLDALIGFLYLSRKGDGCR